MFSYCQVEVIEWKGEDLSTQKDGSLERYQITPGEGHATPNDGSLVDSNISCFYFWFIIMFVTFCGLPLIATLAVQGYSKLIKHI